jgi:hypothetical protein
MGEPDKSSDPYRLGYSRVDPDRAYQSNFAFWREVRPPRRQRGLIVVANALGWLNTVDRSLIADYLKPVNVPLYQWPTDMAFRPAPSTAGAAHAHGGWWSRLEAESRKVLALVFVAALGVLGWQLVTKPENALDPLVVFAWIATWTFVGFALLEVLSLVGFILRTRRRKRGAGKL